MENQNTTPSEPQNDIYELLRKLITSVNEYNENAMSLSGDIEDLQNISVTPECLNFFLWYRNG